MTSLDLMVASYTGASTGQETQIIWDGVKNIFRFFFEFFEIFLYNNIFTKIDDPLK